MQGRLSPMVNNKIQSFPWDYWKQEFQIAYDNGFGIMEWTLDQDRLYDNPIMSDEGRMSIRNLSQEYGVSIPSLTGDCFMQAPFYKIDGKDRDLLLNDLNSILTACGLIGIKLIVFPLVDNGSLESRDQQRELQDGLETVEPLLKLYGMKIVFESDFSAKRLIDFISYFSPEYYGINYDIGNSAALGFDPKEEISIYGNRILNVHIKDRQLHGTTVPLGSGNADIQRVLKTLNTINYNGNYILQTARAKDENHLGVLIKYRDQVIKCIEQSSNANEFRIK